MRKALLLILLLTISSKCYGATVPSLSPNATPAQDDLLYTIDVSDTTDGVTGTGKKSTIGQSLTVISGDATVSSAGVLDLGASVVGSSELSSTTVNPNSYTVANITVDGDGRITAATSSTISTVAGSNTQIQFNDSGVFNGDSGLTYNKTTDALTTGSLITSPATDPYLLLNPNSGSQTLETKYYVAVNSDAGDDNDDIFEIGTGTTVGTNTLLRLTSSGRLDISSTTGGSISASGGIFTIQGLGNTNNEALTINTETTADRVLINTPSAVNLVLSAHPTNETARISLNDATIDYVGFERSNIAFNQRISNTIADSGGAGVATATITTYRVYNVFTCSDADGCNVTLSTTSVPTGMLLILQNIGTNTVTILDTTGVDIGGNQALGNDDTVMLIYSGTEWIRLTAVVDN